MPDPWNGKNADCGRRGAARARGGLVCAWVLAASSFFLPFVARADVRRSPIDQQEVEKMEITKQHAVELLEHGEALGASGHLTQADALFVQGLSEDKDSSILQRRHCEALTAMGKRQEAVTSCYQALQESRSNPNLRATVRAIVSGPNPPLWPDIGIAIDLVQKERQRSPHQFTPIAAACDIAASLGDGAMLQRCARELQTIDPEADETRRATALLSPGCPPWLFWTGWGAIGGAALLTFGHAVGRRLRRASRRRTGAGIAMAQAALCIILSLPSSVHAQPSGGPPIEPPHGMLSKWPINDDDPESSIPSQKDLDADPMEAGYFLQDLIYRAEVYSKHGKHDAAARLYLALAKAVPERSTAFAKLCDEYEIIGDSEKAIGACQAALLRDGVLVRDYEHYVRVVLASPGPLNERRTQALAMVMDHMRKDPAGKPFADELECEISVRTSSRSGLEHCTTNLKVTAPNDPKTISYEWALAMVAGRLDEASGLIDQAKAVGFKAEGIAHMQSALAEAQVNQHRSRVFYSVLAALLLLGAGAVAGAAAMRKARAVSPKTPATV
jgi:tetratricopeptide (TPR) repeat protein